MDDALENTYGVTMANLSPSAQKVQEALNALGFTNQVIELSQTTRSAAEAAQAVGCHVGQIVKSLIFQTQQTRRPILVLASGANRVNEQKLSELLQESIGKPDAEFVREKTGFAIGGVAPVGFSEKLETFIDADLLEFREIWAAAGNPQAVFKLTPAELVKMTQGKVVNIKVQ
jgi:prolyl-tRNA editing enzyme YbaK/EbsC (Cys-tRNA(Pro) deacylase)